VAPKYKSYIKIIFFFLLVKYNQSIFENLFDENIVYSDCENVDKNPNYISFINLETTIDPLCTADGMYTFSKLIEVTIDDSNKFPFIVIVETHDNTGHMNQEITLIKRRVSRNEKYTRQVKIKETQNKKQIDKHPIIIKSCDGQCKKCKSNFWA